MTVSPFDVFRRQTSPAASQSQQYNTAQANKEAIEQNNLRGVLLNTYIKDGQKADSYDFSAISSQLLIPEKIDSEKFVSKNPEEVFDVKKALKPLLIAGAITAGAVATVSIALRGYSKAMANEVGLVRPNDMSRNINILEEPHFAMYQMLRDPSKRKMLGFIGVALMSGVTYALKTLQTVLKRFGLKSKTAI